MSDITYIDVLLDEAISFRDGTHDVRQLENHEQREVASLFFPGCSFLNSSIELVDEVYQALRHDEQVGGISLMCCEKPLDYKGDRKALKEMLARRFQESLLRHKVRRIITACPNCFYELRKLVSKDAKTENIEIIDLPGVLNDCGHQVFVATAEDLSPIAIHDACPDRGSGRIADSVRSLFPANSLVELEHNRGGSLCCGSIPRAAGNLELVAKDTDTIYSEANQAQARTIVTSCMSCSRLLAKAGISVEGETENDARDDPQDDMLDDTRGILKSGIPIYHYLELVFGKRIDWKATPEHLVLRFRFKDIFDEAEVI